MINEKMNEGDINETLCVREKCPTINLLFHYCKLFETTAYVRTNKHMVVESLSMD